MRPLAVAITGGIGAGKSEALRAFARHGAATISADEIVHELLRGDAGAQREIEEQLGVPIRDGSAAERAALAAAVFGDRERVERLEAVLHPRVVRAQQRWLEAVRERVAVVEVPLLYETGGDARFDAVVVVTAPHEVREARKNLTRIAEREARLIPDDEKVVRADFVYVNDGSLDELDAFVARVMRELEARVA